jgi:hypothetical protein
MPTATFQPKFSATDVFPFIVFKSLPSKLNIQAVPASFVAPTLLLLFVITNLPQPIATPL